MNTELNSFEDIKQISENGILYWSARDLQKVLGYGKWENFSRVIDKAMLACDMAGFDIKDHFPCVNKMVEMPVGEQFGSRGFPDVGKTQKIIDYQLSRYACYLNEEYAIFQNRGYQGLYGGLSVSDIHDRKQLGEKDKILDFMGSEEMIANLFRISQTQSKITRENIRSKEFASYTHFTVGKEVREAIMRLGGVMPEELPTPQRGIVELEREAIKKLKERNNEIMTDE